MPRPPLHTRRPLLAGLLRQFPLLALLGGVGIGLAVITFGYWRKGLVVVGLVLLGGALLRLLLPVRRAGFLAVRSRSLDALFLGGLGIALTGLALSIPGG